MSIRCTSMNISLGGPEYVATVASEEQLLKRRS